MNATHRSVSQTPLPLKCVDAGLLLALFGVPFLFGGRLEAGQLLVVVSAIWCALSWAVWQLSFDRPHWIRSHVEPLLLAIIALGLLQTIPLPHFVVSLLSPRIDSLLSAWNAGGPAAVSSGWNHLSLTVGESRAGLALGIAYALLFVVTIQRIQLVEDVARILRWTAIAGMVMGVFGLLQYAFANGRMFWVYEHPFVNTHDRPIGGFLNKNHYAHFLALTIGPLVWFLMTLLKVSRTQRGSETRFAGVSMPSILMAGILGLGTVLMVLGILFARSRGGFLAAGVAMSLSLLVLFAKGVIDRRQAGALCGVLTVVVAIMAVADERETSQVLRRLDTWSDNGRLEIWEANLQTLSEFPVVGTGVGSHRYSSPRFLDIPFMDVEYTHAESGYLQIASETGLAGLSLLCVCLATCGYWCIQGLRRSRSREVTLALVATTAGLTASVIQSVVDFVWYVPGCMIVVVQLLACACRLYQFATAPNGGAEQQQRRLSWMAPPVALAGLTATGIWMVCLYLPRVMAEPHWLLYQRLSQSELTETSSGQAAESDDHAERLKRQVLALRNAVRANPADSRFHQRLAGQCIQIFNRLEAQSEMGLALNQIRDAAQSGGFESPQQIQAWLNDACGSTQAGWLRIGAAHARRSVLLNPLEARSYLHLSELGFVNGADAESSSQYLRQALALAPHDPGILMAAGREAWLAGDTDTWLAHWKSAFQRDRAIQEAILQQLPGWTERPVDVLVDSFQPDIAALQRLAEILEQTSNPQLPQALEVLAGRLVERAQSPDCADRTGDWLAASATYGKLGQLDRIQECFEHALEDAPSDFNVRFEYGAWLLRQERRSDAFEHLNWCRRMRPNHPRVNELYARALKSSPTDSGILHASGQLESGPDDNSR